MRLLITFVRILRRLQFRARSLRATIGHGAFFVVGPRVRVAPRVRVNFGDRVNLGAEVAIQTHLEIGSDVMISSRVAFIGNDHDFGDPARTIQEQGLLPKSHIVLEGDNLVGFGTILLGNVRIGRGTIIGAGSLVTSDLPPDTICVGRPAKPIRSRR